MLFWNKKGILKVQAIKEEVKKMIVKIRHNTHRVKDGAPMTKRVQVIGSFIKYLSDALKGVGQKDLSPLAYGSKFASVFGGHIHVACTNKAENIYRVSWLYAAGRGGIATGKHDVPRVATIKVENGVDLEEYLENLLDYPEPIFISLP